MKNYMSYQSGVFFLFGFTISLWCICTDGIKDHVESTAVENHMKINIYFFFISQHTSINNISQSFQGPFSSFHRCMC